MEAGELLKQIDALGANQYYGVPDSQLSALCDTIYSKYGVSGKHMVAANEGNAVGLAAGHYLATGRPAMVYLQNSGIGNIVNPVCSLLNDDVYAIPCIFVVGWRGEPGVHDEPQHVFQGKNTPALLKDIGIEWFIIDKETTNAQLAEQCGAFKKILEKGASVAFVVKKGSLSGEKVEYQNGNAMLREQVIKEVTAVSGEDVIVSTTGKTSRELFELRETHEKDFLTVGSMGHSSSIALAIAQSKPETKVWCIDGDGAAIMHMGAMAVIGAARPKNMVHIVINNAAHESVGGMPTAAGSVDLVSIAKACGYGHVISVDDVPQLKFALTTAKKANGLTFIEAKAAIGSRADLGRPSTTPQQNKQAFMDFLKEKK